jgi:hypothetical protein
MTPQSGSVNGRKGQTGAYKDKSKPVDIRSSNINAAKGSSIVICTCLSCIVVVLIQYVEFFLPDLIERIWSGDIIVHTDAHNLKF